MLEREEMPLGHYKTNIIRFIYNISVLFMQIKRL